MKTLKISAITLSLFCFGSIAQAQSASSPLLDIATAIGQTQGGRIGQAAQILQAVRGVPQVNTNTVGNTTATPSSSGVTPATTQQTNAAMSAAGAILSATGKTKSASQIYNIQNIMGQTGILGGTQISSQQPGSPIYPTAQQPTLNTQTVNQAASVAAAILGAKGNYGQANQVLQGQNVLGAVTSLAGMATANSQGVPNTMAQQNGRINTDQLNQLGQLAGSILSATGKYNAAQQVFAGQSVLNGVNQVSSNPQNIGQMTQIAQQVLSAVGSTNAAGNLNNVNNALSVLGVLQGQGNQAQAINSVIQAVGSGR